MIAVDTSVWIHFFRQSSERLTAHLNYLLDANQVLLPLPVKFEILSGASKTNLRALTRNLSALPIVKPNMKTWDLIESALPVAISNGCRFGFADLLIAALTIQESASLWTLDSDFTRLARLNLVQLYKYSL